jgi:hypothetical protein
MTRGGDLFELQTPERLTGAPESSSLLLTPIQDDGSNANPSPSRRETLASLAFLPTPTVMDMGANYTPEEWAAWKAKQQAAHQNGNGHGASLTQEAISLLPTPRATRGGSATETVSLLPTPTAQAAKHGSTPDVTAHGFGSNVWDLPHLLPTPTVAADRKSRKSMVEDAQWAAPGLAQAVEIAQGILPREFRDWSEVPGHSGASTPPPSDAGSESSDGPHPAPPSQVPTDDHDSPLYLWNG